MNPAAQVWLCPDGCCTYETPAGGPAPLAQALGWDRPGAEPLCPFDLKVMVRETPETRAAYDARKRERFGERKRPRWFGGGR